VRADSVRLAFLRKALKRWARANVRRFPWRETAEPYRVLVAELMLRRTRPGQVLPIYEAFIQRYPTPAALASAKEADLHSLLAPLGLRWRARNIVAASREMVKVPESGFRSADALKKLPGVGEYVARAVQIMAFNRPEAVIDTNVIRVLGRYWGLRVHPEVRRERRFKELARRCVPRSDVKTYTLALLDVGAAICTPRRPRCGECPLVSSCTFACATTMGAARRRKVGDRVA
jgi:A/G-specific adenine glycosylase